VSEFDPLPTEHSTYVTFKLVQKAQGIRARVFTPRSSRLYYAALGQIGKWRMTDWHSLTLSLTPWSRVLLENLTGPQLVEKFPKFNGIRLFITIFTCLYSEPDQSSPCSHPISWWSILILTSRGCLDLPSDLFPSRLPTKTLYVPLLFSIHVVCLISLIKYVRSVNVTQNLDGYVYHLLLFIHVRPSEEPTITGVAFRHKKDHTLALDATCWTPNA